MKAAISSSSGGKVLQVLKVRSLNIQSRAQSQSARAMPLSSTDPVGRDDEECTNERLPEASNHQTSSAQVQDKASLCHMPEWSGESKFSGGKDPQEVEQRGRKKD